MGGNKLFTVFFCQAVAVRWEEKHSCCYTAHSEHKLFSAQLCFHSKLPGNRKQSRIGNLKRESRLDVITKRTATPPARREILLLSTAFTVCSEQKLCRVQVPYSTVSPTPVSLNPEEADACSFTPPNSYFSYLGVLWKQQKSHNIVKTNSLKTKV